MNNPKIIIITIINLQYHKNFFTLNPKKFNFLNKKSIISLIIKWPLSQINRKGRQIKRVIILTHLKSIIFLKKFRKLIITTNNQRNLKNNFINFSFHKVLNKIAS